MNGIGIDVGSTYTKYCVMENGTITHLHSEKTPIRQQEYFENVKKDLRKRYPDLDIVSCGYGKQNVNDGKKINELTALAKGVGFLAPESNVVLDIGGQDTKVIVQENGCLKKFFVNNKCAAGSGMFLASTLQMLEKNFEDIDLRNIGEPSVALASVCAVFAQSEIVRLLADNVSPDEIIYALVWHILTKAKELLSKVKIGSNGILLSGGLTQIIGFDEFSSKAFQEMCCINKKAAYFSSIGCALTLSGDC